MRGITLIGMPGVGKSAVGRIMAEILNWQFVDLDKLILETEGISHDHYMKAKGEAALKVLEQKLTLELNFQDMVFSPPGSIIFAEIAIQKIKKDSIVVYLSTTADIILKRLGDRLYQNGIIGLKEKGLTGIMAERVPLYEKYADFTFESADQSKQVMAQKVIDGLKSAGILP